MPFAMLVQVYGARCSGWLGYFAIHTWIAAKPAGARAYTSYEVSECRLRRNGSAVAIRKRAPGARSAGNAPAFLASKRGVGVDAPIERIDKAAREYPYAREYTAWPDPIPIPSPRTLPARCRARAGPAADRDRQGLSRRPAAHDCAERRRLPAVAVRPAWRAGKRRRGLRSQRARPRVRHQSVSGAQAPALRQARRTSLERPRRSGKHRGRLFQDRARAGLISGLIEQARAGASGRGAKTMGTRRFEAWPQIKEHRGLLGGVVDRFRTRSRRARAEMFLRIFDLSASTRVLDLGGGDGSHMHAVLEGSPVAPANTYVADIETAAVEDAAACYGFTPVVIAETGRLPFSDGFFDIVFCSSVLEHVTVPKELMWNLTSGSRFRSIARRRQREFSEEIRRIGRGYFVQVPYRWYPIETHSWLPCFGYLPRPAQILLLRLTNRFWIKQTIPDFHLPSEAEMRSYFPDARILREKAFGMTKSLIAYRRV